MREKLSKALRTLSPLPVQTFKPPRGQKQVFLPNFTLTLLRTPFSPPHFVSFLTPLNLNKLDLKDYLYHAYGLEVLSVRSFVIQAKVRMDRVRAKIPVRNRWFRPRATKKMTVELAPDKPFLWPDEPEDLTPWDKTTFEAATKEQERAERRQQEGTKLPHEDAKSLRQQAANLLEGKERWSSGRGLGVTTS